MTDRALTNAEKRRDDLAAQINKLTQAVEEMRKSLDAVENFIADWHRFADSAESTGVDTMKNSSYPQTAVDKLTGSFLPDSDPPLALAQKNPARAVVGRHAREIIEALQRPVPRQELFDSLGHRGIYIHGKDPQMVLSTMMWRMPEQFVRLAGHGYWLKEIPWAPANYDPSLHADHVDMDDIEVLANQALDPESVSDA